MDLFEKIEEIRKKPEHIRLRYVWAMVAISMIFVLAIWFFSMAGNSEKNSALGTSDLNAIVNQFDSQKDSLQNSVNDLKDSFNQDALTKMQDTSMGDNLNNNQ